MNASAQFYSISEVFSRALGLFQRRLGLIAALSVLIGGGTGVLIIGCLLLTVTLGDRAGATNYEYYAFLILYSLIQPFLTGFALLTAALTRVLDAERRGRDPSFGDSLGAVLDRSGTLLLLSLLIPTAIFAGLLLLVVPGLILLARWIQAVPIVATENCGLVTALRRSAALSRGWRSKLVRTATSAVVLSALCNGGIGVGLAAVTAVHPVLGLAFSLVGSCVAVAVPAAAIASSFIELCELNPGFGREDLAEVFA